MESFFALLIVLGSWALILWAYFSWRRGRRERQQRQAEKLRQTWADALPMWDAYLNDGRDRGAATYDYRMREYQDWKRKVDNSLNGAGGSWSDKAGLAAAILRNMDAVAQALGRSIGPPR